MSKEHPSGNLQMIPIDKIEVLNSRDRNGKVPLLNFEWVTVHEDGSPRPGVKGGRSPAQRTLDAWNRAIRWSMAGCGAVTHPAIETRAVFG